MLHSCPQTLYDSRYGWCCRYLANGSGFVTEQSQAGSTPAGGSARENSQIRCICGQPHDKGTMIQCEVSLSGPIADAGNNMLP